MREALITTLEILDIKYCNYKTWLFMRVDKSNRNIMIIFLEKNNYNYVINDYEIMIFFNKEGNKMLYDGWLKIEEIRHGGKKYEKLKLYDAVCGIVINNDDKILLVKQYRPCIGKYSWEIPAGCLDVVGEDPMETMVRELKEETGIELNQLISLVLVKKYYTVIGCSDSMSYIYLIYTDAESIDKKIEDDDVEEIKWFTLSEFKKMINDEEILDNKTQRAYEYIIKEKIIT